MASSAPLSPWGRRVMILVVLFVGLSRTSRPLAAAADGAGAAGVGMASDELQGLMEVVGDLLDDPSWPELHPHPCTDTPWPGIQCEALPSGDPSVLHVTKLHIGPDVASPPCKPSATLSPSLLRKLPYLKSLSLFSCFLSPNSSSNTSLPPALFSSSSNSSFPPALEQLVLNSNPSLTGEIPTTIAQLGRSLRVLSLSQNGLAGSVPRELGRLPLLRQLDLSYNKLTGSIPAEIGDLGSLAILDLSNNALRGSVPPSVGKLRSLQKLDLSSNSLSGRIPPELGQLGGTLVLLDLSRNHLTGPIPDTFCGLNGSLEYLMVEENPVNATLPAFLGVLARLSVLGMSGCGLVGPIPETLARLGRLTALALDRNGLTGTVPAGLAALPNLGQLNLSQNRLTGEVGFTEEFVRRLGKRLDVRDNVGLCADPRTYGELSVLYQAGPPCAAAASGAGRDGGNDGSAAGTSGVAGKDSSSTGHLFFCHRLVSRLVLPLLLSCLPSALFL